MMSLRDKQIHALKQMLNLNETDSKSANSVPTWKILIYDRVGQDIISPLISVRELRDLGITLHMQLHSDRDAIPEVPAIYFCAPSEENIVRIGQDLDNGLYDIYHLNFISPISRQKMEDLASAALAAGAVGNIQKVFDQYLNFITLEDDMFILRHQNSDAISYHTINRGEMKDTEMEMIMDTIVDSLFSVFVTLGTVPIIRCPRGNAAEMVGKKLDKKLRENVWDTRNSLFQGEVNRTGHFSFQRPLLIVLDRSIDMTTPLHHTWTYQALAHDVLELSLNRLVVEENVGKSPSGGARAKTRAYELNNSDRFWSQHKGTPFPRVAEAIQEELEQYRSCEDQVKQLKHSMGIENDNDAGLSMVSNTARLTNAVNSLPQLMETKRLVDMHTNIATGILNAIKSRRLDTFFEIEEKIMSKQTLDRTVIDIINDPDSGTPDDKIRLFVIYYLHSNMSDAECSRHEEALAKAGCDLTPLIHIKRWRSYTKLPRDQNNYEGGTRTVSMFSKLMNQGSSFVMEGVKNLVVKRHNLPVTKIVDDLMEMKQNSSFDDYFYLDPKQLKQVEQVPKNRTTFQDVIVFVVGGGNYIEYQNLNDYAKQKTGTGANKRIVYGSTTLINARQFLKQISLLGQEIH